MNKFKRTLSIITSAALAASAFSAFTVTAGAAAGDTLFSYDFESGEPWTIGGSNSGTFTNSIESDSALNSNVYSLLINGNQNGGRSCNLTLPTAATADLTEISFDFYSTKTWYNTLNFTIQDSSGNSIFKLSDNTYSQLLINDTSTSLSIKNWYNIDAVLDFDSHKVTSLVISKNGEAVYTQSDAIDFISDSASNVGKIALDYYKGSGGTLYSGEGVKLDNFTAKKIIRLTYADGKVTANENGYVVIASYDGNGRMTAAKSYSVSEGVAQDVDASAGDKIMFWDGKDNINPLTAPITVAEAATEEPTPTPTETPTATPAATPTATPTAEPGSNVVYIDEPFAYEDQTIIKSVGSNVASAPDPVTLDNIKYYAGRRANATAINNTASIKSNKLVIDADGTSTSGRGILFDFSPVTIPTVSELESGQVLEMSFDVQTNNTFTVTNYGQLTTSDLTTGSVHARIILDKEANKQYLIVTDANGDVVNSKVSTLSMQTFEGMSFRDGSAYVTLDNLKVETKAKDYGIVNFAIKDNANAAVSDAAIAIGDYTLTTDSNGAAAAVLPNGTYTAEATKSGYGHTDGGFDSDSASITVNSNTQDVSFLLFEMVYDKIPETVTIENGQGFITAPKTADTISTAAFTVSVLDQYDIEVTDSSEYTLTWAIYPAGTETADDYVSISDGGVVSVSKDFTTDNKIAAYYITATVVMNNAGLRGQTVRKTLYVGNNDVVYYEPIAWSQAAGNRGGSVSLASAVTLPDVSSITLNLTMQAPETQRTLFLVTNTGNFVGLQYKSSGDIIVGTGWSGDSAFNQSSDVDKFTNKETLITGYSSNSALAVTFTIDKTTNNITVSSGTSTVSLPFVASSPTTFTGFKTGLYRNYGAMTMADVLVVEPDANYLSIAGDKDFAKVSGQTITREYTLNQSVIVPGETFNWSVSPVDSGITVNDGVLSVADTAVAGTYTLTATSASNAAKTASISVEIGDFQTISAANATITGANAYQLGTDKTGTYAITKLVDSYGDDVTKLLPSAVWTSSNTSAATITGDGTLTVVGGGSTTLTATITNGTAVTTLTVPVTVASYYITEDATGDSTMVDTSNLITDRAITGYQITTSKDNKLVNQWTETTAPTTVDTTGADKLEIAPIYTLTNLTKWVSGTVNVPADTYNFHITGSGGHMDVNVNGQMLANNFLQYGSSPDNIAVNDIVVSAGHATVTLSDAQSDSKVTSITIVKSPSIVERTRKVYVLGDSLVCIYYDGGSAENWTAQTGWGQVLQSYIKDAEVVDLGNSGVTAEGLAGSAITQVATSGKQGDIMILESGYNDRSYSTQDKMKAAVTSMYNAANAKGVTVVMTSPNASQHDYKAGVSWGSVMGTAATETGARYIDLANLSYSFLYSTYGENTDAVKASYNVSDGLHANYNGANKFASIVAGGLIDVGLSNYVNTSYTYTFTDTLGNAITCRAAASN